MNELKRCPFCGGEAYIGFESRFPALDNGVFCTECPAKMVFGDNMGEVIKAWNRRATE